MKTLFWSLLLSCTGIIAHAQVPSWQWVRQNTGTGLATANDIVPGPDNGFYLAGRFTDSVRFGNHSLTNSGHDVLEFYVARFDDQGSCLWLRHIGGYNPPSNVFTGTYQFPMGVDSQGNVYVETIADTLFLADTTLIGTSSFLLKFNQAGKRIWVRKLPETLGLSVKGSHIFLAGAVNGNVQFDNLSLPALGILSDVVAFRLDTSGALQWGKRMGTSRFETCATMAVDEDQNMVFSGQFTDSVEFDGVKVVSINPGGCANCNTYLAKLDSNGVVQWAKAYLGGYGGSPHLAFMPNGKLVGMFGANDIRAMNPDGSHHWSRNIGNAVITALSVSPTGKLTMGFARLDSASFPPYLFVKPAKVSSTSFPFVLGVAQTDSLGNLLWAKGIPSDNAYFDDLPAISCDTSGAVLVAGQASERTVLDGHVVSNPGFLSAFVAKTGAPTSLPRIESGLPANVSLSPNPTSGSLSLEWKGAHYTQLQILESTGRVVRSQSLNKGLERTTLDLQPLSPGIYYIRLQGPSGTATGKVILQP